MKAEPSAARDDQANNQHKKNKSRPDEQFGESPQGGSNDGGASGSFDCNICLELAQDPVVTLCGHLFCWPCIYRWLKMRAFSQECPVCKASIVEENLIPLYGRGKIGSTDPRKKPVTGIDIPERPAGHRPGTARPQSGNPQHPRSFNLTGGHHTHISPGPPPNITLSAGFGLFPSLFGYQIHGFHDHGTFLGGPGTAYGVAGGIQGNNTHVPQPGRSDQRQDIFLYRLFLFLACFAFACLLLF